jgi:hypothetical protein
MTIQAKQTSKYLLITYCVQRDVVGFAGHTSLKRIFKKNLLGEVIFKKSIIFKVFYLGR